MEIVFLCTGNTCRSPLAAAIAEAALARTGSRDVVSSACVHARPGDPATEDAQAVAAEHGLDLSTHRARILTPDTAKSADLIVAMTDEHAAAAEALGAKRVLIIGPISDPVGRGRDAYRETFALLAERVPPVLAH